MFKILVMYFCTVIIAMFISPDGIPDQIRTGFITLSVLVFVIAGFQMFKDWGGE